MARRTKRKRYARHAAKLADAVADTYRRIDSTHRRLILENFIGWAYAQGHPAPTTDKEVAAMAAMFELFLAERKTDTEWHTQFRQMCADRHRGRHRAAGWFVACRTLSRVLPMSSWQRYKIGREPRRY